MLLDRKGEPAVSDSYIVRLVSTTKGLDQHTSFYGPYASFRAACDASDDLDSYYRRSPLKLDGRSTTTECFVETLRTPPRLLCPCGKPAAHRHADPDSADWACRVPDPALF
jgi:hypothetical protein